jgi:serine/threonine-protein kinase
MPPERTTWVGATLAGRYEVVERLGQGAMATVYRARDARLGRDVVVKVPHPELLLLDDFRARFERERESLVKAEHPGVVRILDAGEHEGLPWLALQHLPGGSLGDRIRAHPEGLDGAAVAAWLPEVARALDDLHAAGLLHRDVKPDNITSGWRGRSRAPTCG